MCATAKSGKLRHDRAYPSHCPARCSSDGVCRPQAGVLVFSSTSHSTVAAVLCLAAALGLLGGVARRQCRHGCIVPTRFSEHSGWILDTHGWAPRCFLATLVLVTVFLVSPSYRGSFCLVARWSLSLSKRRRWCRLSLIFVSVLWFCAFCVCIHGSLWALRSHLLSFNCDFCVPSGVSLRETGRSNVSVALSHRCCTVLSESLWRPVRGVSVAFVEECRSRISSL